ncbi:glycine betaine ABC transporter substrate-binding protein [Lederbergia ruris]|uniref:glycine betaine ABC transporter substrate-binding protein n=1 Tax=Lederbergia ruris TaxID=217495 RepID=UPI001BB3D42A|nr:glycine betaine ABC transporter substrate-binding protein [Lederbergia ruris]
MFKEITGLSLATLLAVGLAACGSSAAKENDAQKGQTVGDQVDYTIVGTDPGSGLMQATEKALEEYDLSDWELVSGSGASMTAALKRAYDKEEPIVFTAWSPHWKFIKYDLKFLDDPNLLYGDAEEIHTLARKGLKEDKPEAYTILERFHWDTEDMGEIMVAIEDGEDPEMAAQAWVDDNKEKVAEWTKDVPKVKGDKIKLAYAPWDSEIASHYMMRQVLEGMGYDVTISSVEPGPMFAGVADGSADATLAAWLPITHKNYIEKYEGDLDDLGVNMEGVRQGLAVPTYMEDVNSIEDLKD